jgi:hypothetical protein
MSDHLEAGIDRLRRHGSGHTLHRYLDNRGRE